MGLTKEKILANATKFYNTGEKYGFTTDELRDFLGLEFIGAPASTMKSLNNAFEGGLIDHTLRVTSYAIKINEILPKESQIALDSLIKVACLHQIGKAKLYVENKSEWHRTNQGKMYEFNDKLTSMSVGERSLFYALSNGVRLNEEESQAILNFGKDDSDKQAKYHSSTLAVVLRQAVDLAILEEKSKQVAESLKTVE